MRDEMNDELIDRVAETLREPVRVSPAVDARVMAAVRAIAAGAPSGAGIPQADPLFAAPTPARELSIAAHRDRAARRGALGWLTSPRELRVSPLLGLAVAAGLAAIVVTSATAAHRAGAERAREELVVAQQAAPAARGTEAIVVSGPTESAPAGAMRVVSFVFAAPGASSVSLAADFNDWAPGALPLVQSAPGVWSVAVPLAPGHYSYSFVVDGEKWEADPAAPRAADDFGMPSSTLVVGAR